MNALLRAVTSMDAPKHPKQIPFENIYIESLTINWVISSQFFIFQYRQIDIVLGSMMLAKCWN